MAYKVNNLNSDGSIEQTVSTSGTTGSLQFNDGSGGLSGASHVGITGGNLCLKTTTNPGNAPANNVILWAQDIGDRKMPCMSDDSGNSNNLQLCVGRSKIGQWSFVGNATTAALANGMAAPSTAGTATSRNVATTSELASMRRNAWVSATTADAVASIRTASLQFWRGNAEGLGGFMFVMRFGPSDAANLGTGPYMFCGLRDQTGAPTSVNPTTLTNIIGVAQLAGSTNMHVIHNDASGSATTIDLGVDFPLSLNTEAYEATFAAPPNGSSVGYQIKRLGTTYEANGTISSDLPANTTLMAIQMWRSNNAKTGSAVGLDVSSVYIETAV